MANYSRAHERDECAKMWRGFWHSTFGILLCWVPLVGLLLSISGFARQMVRMTEQYKKRLFLFIVYGLLSLMVSIGAIVYGLYSYSRDPDILSKATLQVWTALTGQKSLPGQPAPTDYTGNPNPGLGTYVGAGLNDEGAPLDEGDLGDELDQVPDNEADSVQAMGLDDGGAFLDDEEFDELPFVYEMMDDQSTEVNGLLRVDYKVIIDSEQPPTKDELLQMFDEIIFEDGYDLHTMAVFTYEDETITDDGESELPAEYTVAFMEETIQGEPPALTLKAAPASSLSPEPASAEAGIVG